MSRPLRRGAHLAIRGYQLTLSGLAGRQCRHLPSCSDYADEAIQRHGLWAGGWMGAARICRCGPFGTSGLDIVPEALPAQARWYKPWVYGRWRGVLESAIRCEAAEPELRPSTPRSASAIVTPPVQRREAGRAGRSSVAP